MQLYSTIDNVRKTLVILFAAGLLFRAAFLITGFSVEGSRYYMTYSDSYGYVTLADNLLKGNGFSMSSEPPYVKDSIRVPGYPFFLALSRILTGGFWLAIAIQMLFGAALPMLLYEVLRRLSFSKKVVLIVCFVAAFEPLSAAFSVFLTSEVLFTFIFFLSFLCYLEYHKERHIEFLIVSALLLGATTLIRPIALYAIFLFALHFVCVSGWRQKMTWKLVLFFTAAALTVLAPWMYRNLRLFESFTLSSVPYYNIYVWHGGSIVAVGNDTRFDDEREKLEEDLRAKGFGVTESLGAKEYMKRGARRIVREYPLAFLKLDTYNSWKFFTMDGYYDLATHLGFYKHDDQSLSFLDFRNSLRRLPAILLSDQLFIFFVGGRLLWIILLPFFLWGVWLSVRARENRARDAFLVLLIFYFMAASLTTGFGMNARFRIPVAPLYLAYAATVLISSAAWYKKRKTYSASIKVS